MFIAVLTLTAMALSIGLTLLWLGRKMAPDEDSLVEQINEILPEPQRGQCRFPLCAPYAHAIHHGHADNPQCPPAGADGVRKRAGPLDGEPDRGAGSCRAHEP